MDENKSITKKIEVLEIIHPDTSISEHKLWVEKAIKKLQSEFDTNEDLTMADKIKVLTLVGNYIKGQESNPMVLMEAIKTLPEHKARVVMGLLEKENIISALKKKSKKSLFY